MTLFTLEGEEFGSDVFVILQVRPHFGLALSTHQSNFLSFINYLRLYDVLKTIKPLLNVSWWVFVFEQIWSRNTPDDMITLVIRLKMLKLVMSTCLCGDNELF